MTKWIVYLLVPLGFYLRYQEFRGRPLWSDEAITSILAVGQAGGREFLQVLYYNLFNISTDLGLRMPIMIASSLTPLALYLVAGKKSLPFCILIAISPYFVFWGGIARPYALAAFFCILGARWKWFYIPAILATPFAITGLNLWEAENRWKFYLFLIIWAVGWYYYMPLSGSNHFNMELLINAKRLWYIPLCVGILTLCLIDWDKLARVRSYFFRLVKS